MLELYLDIVIKIYWIVMPVLVSLSLCSGHVVSLTRV